MCDLTSSQSLQNPYCDWNDFILMVFQSVHLNQRCCLIPLKSRLCSLKQSDLTTVKVKESKHPFSLPCSVLLYPFLWPVELTLPSFNPQRSFPGEQRLPFVWAQIRTIKCHYIVFRTQPEFIYNVKTKSWFFYWLFAITQPRWSPGISIHRTFAQGNTKMLVNLLLFFFTVWKWPVLNFCPRSQFCRSPHMSKLF